MKQHNISKSLYLIKRTAEKRNLSEEKLGCFTVKARVDLASIKRYSCPSPLGHLCEWTLEASNKIFLFSFSDI